MMIKVNARLKKALLVIGQLQNKIGAAQGLHYTDVDPNAFEKAQALLDEAFELCVTTLSEYPPQDS